MKSQNKDLSSVFIDTSAYYALADKNDVNHKKARIFFEKLLLYQTTLITHNYVLVECSALMLHRLGLVVTKTFLNEATMFDVVWINESIHSQSFEYFSKRKKRKLSFVDCVSSVVMRQKNITAAFAFDSDFTKEGLTLLP